MNIDRSSVGEAEFSEGLRFLGSAYSEKRKTPGCVHEWRSPGAPPAVPLFVQPAKMNAIAKTSGAKATTFLFSVMLLPRRVRRASSRGRRLGCGRNRDRRQARSQKV